MFYRIINFCVLAFILLTRTSLAQTEIFAVKPENKDYLKYLYYENRFDSGVVKYRLGEIQVSTGLNQKRVNILSNLTENQSVQSTDLPGICTDLLSYSKTENFLVSTNSVITFSRWIYGSAEPCEEPETDSVLICGGMPRGILDQTEFVLELLRVADDARIAILDSVGSMPVNLLSPSSLDTRYGTSYASSLRSFTLTNSIATNTPVYLRVSPRRYGSTPYGISVQQMSSWVNYSAILDSTGSFNISRAVYDSLIAHEFNEIIAYCDSVKNATGSMPRQSFEFPKTEYMEAYWSRYFDEYTQPNNQKYYIEKNPSYPRSGANDLAALKKRSRIVSEEKTGFWPIKTQPITTDNFEINISAHKEFVASSIDLYTVEGRQMKKLWVGSLKRGKNSMVLNLNKINTGMYILIFKNEKDQSVCSEKIVINR